MELEAASDTRRRSIKVAVIGLASCLTLMLGHSVLAAEGAKPAFSLFVRPAMEDTLLLPTSTKDLGIPAKTISIAACPGEYEPASFVVRAARPLSGLTVEVEDLQGPGGVIPAERVDVRIVKCWFQAGSGAHELDRKHLTPELLLHDGALVRVDLRAGTNAIRHGPPGSTDYRDASTSESRELEGLAPQDAPELRPVDLGAGLNQQYWLTVNVPDDAAPGQYHGAIWIRSRDVPPQRLILELAVRGFRLPNPRLTYSIYYRGKLDPSGEGSVSSELKSEAQYMADLADMLSHGARYVTLYQERKSGLVPRALALRAQAGLPRDRLFSLGIGTGKPTSPEALEGLAERTRVWLGLAEEAGYGQLYVYGVDEAYGRELAKERQAWWLVRSLGAKIFVACGKDALPLMGPLLDVAIVARQPDPRQAASYHALGHEIYCYAFPQVAPVVPETYRRNYGIALWLAGYDGAMPYAYQHSFGHIWNDFDHQHYRDHAFAYPTVNGVVPTMQWEGFREAVDDVRYLTALEQAIQAAPLAKKKEANEARRWLKRLKVGIDLERMREEAAQRTERLLHSSVTEPNTPALEQGMSSMKVLLLVPPERTYIGASSHPVLDRKREPRPKLGILSVATHLKARRPDVSIKVVDCSGDGTNDAQVEALVRTYEPDLVGITCLTFTYRDAVATAQLVRRTSPKAVICMGGFHVTLYPQETLEQECVDLVVVGEGEETFTELVEHLMRREPSLDQIKGLGYKDYTGPRINSRRDPVTNLDSIPHADYDLIDYEKYAHILGKGRITLALESSRGCSFACSFCDIRRSRFRWRSAPSIVREMERWAERGVRSFFFVDDNLTLRRSRVLEMCDMICERGLKVEFKVSSRIDTLDAEVMRALKQAGCSRISVGVETSHQKYLDFLDKGITVAQIERTLETARHVGIPMFAFSMIGFPGETKEEMLEDVRFLHKHRVPFASFSLLNVYPKTGLYYRLLRSGKLSDDPWPTFARNPDHEVKVPTVNELYSDAELRSFQLEMTRRFFFHPSCAVGLLCQVNSWQRLWRYADMGFRFLELRKVLGT